MNHQQHTDSLPPSAKLPSLAVPRQCGRVLALFVLVVIFNTAFSATAYADGSQRTRAQAIEIAKSRSGDGRVLSVKKRVNNKGQSVFAVKIIVNGRVKVYAIPEFAN